MKNILIAIAVVAMALSACGKCHDSTCTATVTCPDGTVLTTVQGRQICLPPTSCVQPDVLDLDLNICVPPEGCIEPKVLTDGYCVPPTQCPSGYVLEGDACTPVFCGKDQQVADCFCQKGQVVKTGEGSRTYCCGAPVANLVTCENVCPSDQHWADGRCVCNASDKVVNPCTKTCEVPK